MKCPRTNDECISTTASCIVTTMQDSMILQIKAYAYGVGIPHEYLVGKSIPALLDLIYQKGVSDANS